MMFRALAILGGAVLVGCGGGGESGGAPPPRVTGGGYSGGGNQVQANDVPIPQENDGSWSLLEHQQWGYIHNDYSQKWLASANQRCGTNVPALFDWESFRHHFSPRADQPFDEATNDHAKVPFQALIELCSGGGTNNNTDPETNKRAMKERLRHIELKYVVGVPSRTVVSNGVITMFMNPADGISFHDLTVAARNEILRSL